MYIYEQEDDIYTKDTQETLLSISTVWDFTHALHE